MPGINCGRVLRSTRCRSPCGCLMMLDGSHEALPLLIPAGQPCRQTLRTNAWRPAARGCRQRSRLHPGGCGRLPTTAGLTLDISLQIRHLHIENMSEGRKALALTSSSLGLGHAEKWIYLSRAEAVDVQLRLDRFLGRHGPVLWCLPSSSHAGGLEHSPNYGLSADRRAIGPKPGKPGAIRRAKICSYTRA
ncbi:hypothetical protein FHT28_001654 [Rhizobium sp. SG570]|nr:hypothetical protein [Rhizobium sp. SG570]